jgi:hypothetical protein
LLFRSLVGLCIWGFELENQQASLGGEFVAEVSQRIGELAEQALVFRIRYRRKNVRWTYPRRFPYRVCYYVDGRIVHVFAGVTSSCR